MALNSGTRLGPYEILSPLGAGGMGEVYRARDTKLGRDVAVKVLPEAVAQHPDVLARFEREARAVAALNHPNILGIYDFGREGGVAYAVMELLEGENLRVRLDNGALPHGLTLSSAGVISGITTASGTSSFTATVTDSLGVTGSQRLRTVLLHRPGERRGPQSGSHQMNKNHGFDPWEYFLS